MSGVQFNPAMADSWRALPRSDSPAGACGKYPVNAMKLRTPGYGSGQRFTAQVCGGQKNPTRVSETAGRAIKWVDADSVHAQCSTI
jgi:hypothetical protein